MSSEQVDERAVRQRQQFIEFGTAFASKAVLTAAVRVLEEMVPTDDATTDKITRAIKELNRFMPTERPACITCTLDEADAALYDYRLQIYLCLVPRDNKCTIEVPSDEYAQDLYKKYAIAKDFSVTYWRHLMRENPGIMKKLKAAKDINWDLQVDASNPTTLYFDPDCTMRAGLFCVWVDGQGRPVMKCT